MTYKPAFDISALASSAKCTTEHCWWNEINFDGLKLGDVAVDHVYATGHTVKIIDRAQTIVSPPRTGFEKIRGALVLRLPRRQP